MVHRVRRREVHRSRELVQLGRPLRKRLGRHELLRKVRSALSPSRVRKLCKASRVAGCEVHDGLVVLIEVFFFFWRDRSFDL